MLVRKSESYGKVGSSDQKLTSILSSGLRDRWIGRRSPLKESGQSTLRAASAIKSNLYGRICRSSSFIDKNQKNEDEECSPSFILNLLPFIFHLLSLCLKHEKATSNIFHSVNCSTCGYWFYVIFDHPR